jgi:thioredoxin-dependent peroxiredoxin
MVWSRDERGKLFCFTRPLTVSPTVDVNALALETRRAHAQPPKVHPMLTVGDKIPSFSLTNDSGDTITDQSLGGRTVVLYFYPKDDTPGCTKEAIAFTQHHDAFVQAGAQVIGVSRDPVDQHTKFKHKYAIKIPLLSDPDAHLHRAFGAWGMKNNYGKEYEGALRSTFIIDKYGTVVRVFSSVKVDGHAEAVLGALTGEAVPVSTGATMMPPAKKEKAAKQAKSAAPKKAAAKKAAAPKKAAAKKAKPAAKKKAAPKKAKAKPAAKKSAAKKSAKKPVSKKAAPKKSKKAAPKKKKK